MHYLYIKQCTHCSLKYFGQTKGNPIPYKGSGKYWKKHLKKHNVIKPVTLQIFEFNSIDDAEEFAIKFSIDNNIVTSLEWANLMIENARTGSYQCSDLTKDKIRQTKLGTHASAETKLKMSKSRIGNKNRLGIPHSEETKLKISNSSKGKLPWNTGLSGYKKPLSEVGKLSLSQKLTGRIYSEETKLKMSNSKKGKPTWNKGIPAVKVVSRISDKKEFSKSHWNQWMAKNPNEIIY